MINLIVPVYNVENYLPRCVDSILAQTFTDFELILIDDGSQDNSGKICDEYATKDNRVIVYHQENRGQAAARNFALDVVKGEYIAFADSDDYLHPKMLETLFEVLNKSEADISVCSHKKGNEDNYLWPKLNNNFSVYNGKEFLIHCYNDKVEKCWVMWDKLYRRSCFDNIRFPVGRICEDNAIIYKILYNHKIADVDSVLYYYYQHSNGTMKSSFDKKYMDWFLVLEEMIEYYSEKNEAELLEYSEKRYLFEVYAKYNESKDRILKNKLKKQLRFIRNKGELVFEKYSYITNTIFPLQSKIYWYKKILNKRIHRSKDVNS